jgi:hypothetical protein
VIAPPLVWRVSEAAGAVAGAGGQQAGAPIAWTSIATKPIEPPRRG